MIRLKKEFGFDDWYYYKGRKELRDLFSRNEKMVETTEANPGCFFINFNLPARITCPCAKDCLRFCYATQGHYVFETTKDAMEWRRVMSLRDDFAWFISEELKYWRRKAERYWKSRGIDETKLYVRIHDSGDYYDIGYARKWIEIANDNPDCIFYSYTKCVNMWHVLMDNGEIPENFRIIMSEGGTEDLLIRPEDRKAIVVQDESCITKDMVNGTGNDMYATYAKIVALPYHGSKKVKV